LCIQVKNEIHSLQIKREDDFNVVAVYGGSDIHEQVRKIREGCDIIVATPGRLLDLLERGNIRLSNLEVTCLD
jgi:ATP-dependent RNA helicase DeaD